MALVFRANVFMSWVGWEKVSETRSLKDSGAASTMLIPMSSPSASKKTSFNAFVSSCIRENEHNRRRPKHPIEGLFYFN